MDKSKLESDQAYATKNNEYHGYNKPTKQAVDKDEMCRIIGEHYSLGFIANVFNKRLAQMFETALDKWIDTASWEELEHEHDNIVY